VEEERRGPGFTAGLRPALGTVATWVGPDGAGFFCFFCFLATSFT